MTTIYGHLLEMLNELLEMLQLTWLFDGIRYLLSQWFTVKSLENIGFIENCYKSIVWRLQCPNINNQIKFTSG